jgi:hypothetical protein
MVNARSLPVVAYTEDHIPNPYPLVDLPWQKYHAVRNAIVQASRKHGTTGPMGLVKIVDDVESPYLQAIEPGFWPLGDKDPTYYVIDDQYNSEMYCYVELETPNALTLDWLASMVAVLKSHEGWGIGLVSIPSAYVLIFADRLLVNGALSRCKTVDDVLAAVPRLLRRRGKRWWEFWK